MTEKLSSTVTNTAIQIKMMDANISVTMTTKKARSW